MPLHWLPDDRILFPDPEDADESGLLAIGGDLDPDRVLAAYERGIFPWPHEGYPMLWFSPHPRMVLRPDELRISRSLRAALRQGRFEIRLDTAFREVMLGCATVERKHEVGTWITPEMLETYCTLHERGVAHCAEAWRDGELVGGAYGISVGAAFTGESMFARVSDASKVAFVTLVRQLARWGIELVDGQVPSGHLARLGFREWPRARFLEALREARKRPTRPGPWRLDDPGQ
jgi:leucyl/phenylalanyl-tRNA--protein transferase